jgi:hypothetical protein
MISRRLYVALARAETYPVVHYTAGVQEKRAQAAMMAMT